ncbi:winged helix-turn-helix transcriptional regulator [Halovenus sp. HT40]|uniref:winged helix-turn-helix transcriptional regulator n=1 Tax=Halovenus sp. HT40 TaxID=3126691 RepID=UPI00300E7810
MSSGQQQTVDWADGERTAGTPLFTDAESVLHDMQDIVGRKWNPVLLYHLLTDGPLGFSALKSCVDGISSKMLSESLSDLEEQGLVTRELLSDQPVRVEYALTERGESLEPILIGMIQWGSERAER